MSSTSARECTRRETNAYTRSKLASYRSEKRAASFCAAATSSRSSTSFDRPFNRFSAGRALYYINRRRAERLRGNFAGARLGRRLPFGQKDASEDQRRSKQHARSNMFLAERHRRD